MKNSMLLNNQWANRPNHERFVTLESQLEAARWMEADLRRPIIDPARLEIGALPNIVQTPDGREYEEAGGKIITKVDGAYADLGWFGFQKAATLIGMQAGAFRDLPATTTADAMKFKLLRRSQEVGDFRFHVLPYRDDAHQPVRTPEGTSANIVSTVGVDYGFVPNADIIAQLIRLNERMGGIWKVPAASYANADPKRATTLYMGPGDLFNCLVAEDAFMDGNNRPTKVGFMVVNSWLQTKAFEIVLFSYDYICDNRTIWNFGLLSKYTRRHTSLAPQAIKNALPDILGSYSLSVRSGETLKLMEARMKAADAKRDLVVQERDADAKVKKTVAVDSPERAIKWMTDNGYTKALAKTAVEVFMQEEGGAPPQSLGDMVRAGTAGTRGMGDAEARFEKDALVGSWLGKVRDEDAQPRKLFVSPGTPSANGARTAGLVFSR